MKYFGKRSLSSFLSGFFHVSWYIVIVVSIIALAVGVVMIFFTAPFEQFINSNFGCLNADFKDKDWEYIKNLELKWKLIFTPVFLAYFTALVALTLKIIKRSQHLFNNFKNNIVFNKNNVLLISKIGKLLIALSILIFNINSLFVSVLLFMLCEIFNKGSELQEEHDLTV